jgi:hypothetical protein
MSKNKNLSGGLFAFGKPRPLTIRETPLSAQIAEYLDNRGLWNERLNCGKIQTQNGNWIHLCEAGTPDRLTLICGVAVFIETKKRGQNPTAEQLAKHEELRRNGAVVIVADDYFQFMAEFSAIRCEIETKRKGEINFYD